MANVFIKNNIILNNLILFVLFYNNLLWIYIKDILIFLYNYKK